jgi:endonuclease/exonuclease/phosphatase family metal-dependent hydrolase
MPRWIPPHAPRPRARLARLATGALLCALALAPACPRNGDGDADADLDADADADAPPRDRAPLRIVTWNVENFPSSSTTAERLTSLVPQIEADVVGIEEIKDVEAFVQLIQSMPGYDGTYANEPGQDTTVGIIVRTARVRMVDEEVLFATNSYVFPRPPLVVRAEALGEDGRVDFDFLIVVVHLKAQLDAESEERRREACGLLDAWVSERLAADGEHDIVLVGDWNDEITDGTANNVFQVFLDKPEQYTVLTLPAAEAGQFTYIPFQSFIDHVIVTADALDDYGQGTTEVLELERTVPNYAATVSDHRPVRVTFDLP